MTIPFHIQCVIAIVIFGLLLGVGVLIHSIYYLWKRELDQRKYIEWLKEQGILE